MKKKIFREMNGTYTTAVDGMYYPDILLPENESLARITTAECEIHTLKNIGRNFI